MSKVNLTLKPCPFCKGKAEFKYTSGSWGYYAATYAVKCTVCGVMTSAIDDKENVTAKSKITSAEQAQLDAANIWNRRVVESEA